jgi:hypothetical protein
MISADINDFEYSGEIQSIFKVIWFMGATMLQGDISLSDYPPRCCLMPLPSGEGSGAGYLRICHAGVPESQAARLWGHSGEGLTSKLLRTCSMSLVNLSWTCAFRASQSTCNHFICLQQMVDLSEEIMFTGHSQRFGKIFIRQKIPYPLREIPTLPQHSWCPQTSLSARRQNY